MNVIVAVDANWAIGKSGDQLVYIPEDLKHFKELTMGHPVILGRRTMATFPSWRRRRQGCCAVCWTNWSSSTGRSSGPYFRPRWPCTVNCTKSFHSLNSTAIYASIRRYTV